MNTQATGLQRTILGVNDCLLVETGGLLSEQVKLQFMLVEKKR